jgi:hypothetical protein
LNSPSKDPKSSNSLLKCLQRSKVRYQSKSCMSKNSQFNFGLFPYGGRETVQNFGLFLYRSREFGLFQYGSREFGLFPYRSRLFGLLDCFPTAVRKQSRILDCFSTAVGNLDCFHTWLTDWLSDWHTVLALTLPRAFCCSN